jgi:hypothetical protein
MPDSSSEQAASPEKIPFGSKTIAFSPLRIGAKKQTTTFASASFNISREFVLLNQKRI